MTYIEFFDKNAIENICACLIDTPQRVIFIGSSADEMNRHIANYKRVLGGRGHDIEMMVKSIDKRDFDGAVKLLTDIVETYENCVFDITGGEKMLILALGVVFERYKEKNIQIHSINVNNNVICDCDKNGKEVFRVIPAFTALENVRIYGGDIVYGDIDTTNVTYRWKLDEDFEKDIENIWKVCKYNPKEWNIQIGILDAVCGAGEASRDKLTYIAEISDINRFLSKSKSWFSVKEGIIRKLQMYGLVTEFYRDKKTVKIAFKNEQVKKCLTKAGQALEMKVLVCASNLTDKDGEHVYTDVQNGVVIDWDGKIRKEGDSKCDTENEVDVMLMHGIVPVFVSCKNGKVTVDELYKLNTVAHRFGGKYAKKVLVATDLDMSGSVAKYILQRAEDMKITVIDNAAKMSEGELSEKLSSVWC